MALTSRKLPNRFLKPEWQWKEGNKMPCPYGTDDPGDRGMSYLEPEVAEWCRESFNSVPAVWFCDLTDYDKWVQEWRIDFASEADAALFKLKWSDWRR